MGQLRGRSENGASSRTARWTAAKPSGSRRPHQRPRAVIRVPRTRSRHALKLSWSLRASSGPLGNPAGMLMPAPRRWRGSPIARLVRQDDDRCRNWSSQRLPYLHDEPSYGLSGSANTQQIRRGARLLALHTRPVPDFCRTACSFAVLRIVPTARWRPDRSDSHSGA